MRRICPSLALLSLLLLLLAAFGCVAEKARHGGFARPQRQGKGADRAGVQITYLGTNGYLFSAGDTRILVDPYFSRLPLGRIALGQTIAPERARIAWAMSKLPRRIDRIFVTHGHFDHLLDVPAVAHGTGATLVASQTSCFIASAAAAASNQTLQALAVRPGGNVQAGAATVRVLSATHDRILGLTPFPGSVAELPSRPPTKPGDWKLGEPLAFLIELNGKRIYVDSGGVSGAPLPEVAGPVDLAIIGVALPDARRRLGPLLARLQPRWFLPSHQDDFFRPLDEGFRYGPLTDAAAVREAWSRHGGAPDRFVQLDYFQPWTLR